MVELAYPGIGGADLSRKVTYIYDEQNRLKSVTTWLDDTAIYTYDAASLPATLENLNGTLTSYTHDRARRIDTLENRTSSTMAIATYDYTPDGVGNIISSLQTEPLTTTDALGVADYVYNLKKNRLASIGSVLFDFDDNGQLTLKGMDTYSFDYDHRLSAISGTVSASYSYDGLGNRLEATQGGGTNRYIYDIAGNLLAVADETNTILRYYVYGLGLMAMIPPGGATYTYHFNATGSTIAITDSAQQIVNSYAYTPFGIITSQSESGGIVQDFKYVGRYGVMAEQGGFYYMRNRYYDPETGRFISEDPIGFEGGTINLSEYVANNPVNYIDPWGLDATSWLGYGRRPWRDGPRNGNWGGNKWSGGWNPENHNGQPGPAPPTDTADELYMKHDLCYDKCNSLHHEDSREICIRNCDETLLNDLYCLPSDPRKWPKRPKPGTYSDSENFREDAIIYFYHKLH